MADGVLRGMLWGAASLDTLTDVVEWQDCDLDTECLLGFTRLEDGSTAVLFWEDPGVRIALIRETDGRGAPRRETVTLGVVSRNDSLRKAALAYNPGRSLSD